jgi:hypothetical protein
MRGFYSPETTWAILACLAGTFVCAQNAPPQPPIWNSTKDAASFERVETRRLERAQKAIAAVVSVSGKRTVDNTVEPFDEAARELNNAAYLAEFVQQAHPDSDYRDHVLKAEKPNPRGSGLKRVCIKVKQSGREGPNVGFPPLTHDRLAVRN